jgi:putative salt-induced outer membrane protein
MRALHIDYYERVIPMNKTKWILTGILGLGMAVWAGAEEAPPEKPWKNAAEVSVVNANGNSRATTTSAKNLFEYNWGKVSLLQLEGAALGARDSGGVTAENYMAREKVTWKIYGRNYVYEQFKWDKDRFAGIANRYDASAGLGRLILDLPKDKLNGELGGGYINEERTDAPRNDFASGRAYAKYVHAFTESSSFSQDAEYLHNFENSKGYRLNTETALIASISTHLSLKSSFVWKRNALPPPGAVKDDTITSMALVINY